MQISAVISNLREVIACEGLIRAVIVYGHIFRWYFYKRFTGAEFITRSINDYRMLLSLREPGISEILNHYGDREPEHVSILEECLAEGMCVFDIGGNIGYYTLLMASRVGPTGKVYSVEPVPTNFRILKKNVAINEFEERVEASRVAMSNVNGTDRIALSNRSNLHSLNSGSRKQMDSLLDLSGESIDVETIDLATYLEGKRLPELLRMDVEGHEVEILSGLVECAKAMAWYPDVLFEVHAEYYDCGEHDITVPLKALFAFGYQPVMVASNQDPAEEFDKRRLVPAERVKIKNITRGIYRDVDDIALLEIMQVPRQARCVLLRRLDQHGE
jgi:FkbM family methyltransferase